MSPSLFYFGVILEVFTTCLVVLHLMRSALCVGYPRLYRIVHTQCRYITHVFIYLDLNLMRHTSLEGWRPTWHGGILHEAQLEGLIACLGGLPLEILECV